MKKSDCTRLFFFIACFFLACLARVSAQSHTLIPYPAKLVEGQGSFVISPQTAVHLPGNAPFKNEAILLSELVKNSFGKPLTISNSVSKNQIVLRYDETMKAEEAYRLSITPQQVTLFSKSPEGMFRAVQTVRQLLPVSIEKKAVQPRLILPAVEIEDQPSFSWRGIHIDVSRHFFSIDYLRKLIDLMALYKLNKFHLHLTDDQGWRIEIKNYPKLTEEGAWRTFNNQDSVCLERAKENPDFIIDPKHIIQKNGKAVYGGYYTQQQMKDLVRYAEARHVEIIPEIDMPGHMMAAINSYSYLSCDSTNSFGKFFSTPICPCRPEVIEFAKDIFSEIMEIFPSQYIHIGGDEVERSHWERSNDCKLLMQKEGLKNTAEVQAWFIKEMEKFFNSKGKKLLGWDEILDGGISNTATIMYWRTWVPDGPAKAAKNGNKVIMSPNSPMYFSQEPDKNSLPAVYHYEIIPEDLSASAAKNIMGAQGNLWAEYIPNERRADYLYMPRMAALAEIVWSDKRDYRSFLGRLNAHYKRLDNLNVSYRIPDLNVLDNYAFVDATTFSIVPPLDDLIIRYTTDGSAPTVKSTQLKALTLRQSQHVRVAAFTKAGRRGDVYHLIFKKQSPAKAENSKVPGSGLRANWYKRSFDSTTLISGTPDAKLVVAGISVPEEAKAESFSLQYRGYIEVPETGIYTFYLTSDDASFLKIAGRDVINNDGMHPPREKNGQVVLEKGLHSMALDFIEGGGGYTLKLQYSINNSKPQDIPEHWFKMAADE